MIQIKSAENESELKGILELQEANLFQNLSPIEKSEQGFVTVKHSLEQLTAMNELAAHVIAKDGDQVAGYILAMTKASRAVIPVLVPMFEQFDQLKVDGQPISALDYLVIGQICVGKNYRGQGLFDQMYAEYRKKFSGKYEFGITEIATSNLRSLNAHHRVGFETIHIFRDTIQEWAIVVWKWKDLSGRSDKDS
ncbi:GNAT family N-acetyltransferase [Algoriphagus lacus]|uniref:GNAT family N-acetyltransferase n=1 Tax=Algoriphagus lacus TaxID=2056311 RepID=A0A418PPT3_9BACT|nr:GNAT family N-acetyltransferase [Algoriphagus lacus]RIW14093.1 GNAT family N-acetyltransferase [Algoriphagus lacus]